MRATDRPILMRLVVASLIALGCLAPAGLLRPAAQAPAWAWLDAPGQAGAGVPGTLEGGESGRSQRHLRSGESGPVAAERSRRRGEPSRADDRSGAGQATADVRDPVRHGLAWLWIVTPRAGHATSHSIETRGARGPPARPIV